MAENVFGEFRAQEKLDVEIETFYEPKQQSMSFISFSLNWYGFLSLHSPHAYLEY